MQVPIGERIRTLRQRDSRTQADLANLLGVSSQAVSRWESGTTYPDMEIIPAIANVFGVSIDALFGYQGERDSKINALLEEVEMLDRENVQEDINLDRCITLLRTGLAEFPGNEKITYKLASILHDTGWARHENWKHYGEDYTPDADHIQYDFDPQKQNPYWLEASRLFESLISATNDPHIRHDSILQLISIYRGFGESEKGKALANTMPTVEQSREILLATATDGKEQEKYLGEALLHLLDVFSEQYMYALVNNRTNFATEKPIRKVQGLIEMFRFLCDDGNMGQHHRQVSFLYLYLARLQWEYGYREEAFLSLDIALGHAKKFDALAKTSCGKFTAMLLQETEIEIVKYRSCGKLAQGLPEDFPMWCNPEYYTVKAEMILDPRWAEWEKQCRNTAL